jgi:hypothetical protein
MKKEGLLQWFLQKTDCFDPIFKNGGINKVQTALEFYVEKLKDDFEDKK